MEETHKRPRVDTEEGTEGKKYSIGVEAGKELQLELFSGDPTPFIATWQKEKALSLPDGEHVFEFLDLLSMSRRDIMHSVSDFVKNRLLNRISVSSPQQLEALLKLSFKWTGVEELQAIPVNTMLKLLESQKIPSMYLDRLAISPSVLREIPVKIKREVWELHPHVFVEFMREISIRFVSDDERMKVYSGLILSNETESAVFRKRRSGDALLKEIVASIDESIQLYSIAVQVIRDLFDETENYSFCVLRMEVIMAMHDEGHREILSKDDCYRFAWCLDASIPEKTIDSRRLEELEAVYLDMRERKVVTTIADYAMVSSHPLVQSVILSEIIEALKEGIREKVFPRNNRRLTLLSALLALGCWAHKVVHMKKSKCPKAGQNLFDMFYPIINEMITQSKSEDSLSEDLSDRLANSIGTHKSGIHHSILSYYLLLRLQDKDLDQIAIILEVLKTYASDSLESDRRGPRPRPLSWFYRFIHSLCNGLKQPAFAELLLTSQHWGDTLYGNFLLPFAQRSPACHLIVLRLISSWVETPRGHDELLKSLVVELKNTGGSFAQSEEYDFVTYSIINNLKESYDNLFTNHSDMFNQESSMEIEVVNEDSGLEEVVGDPEVDTPMEVEDHQAIQESSIDAGVEPVEDSPMDLDQSEPQ